ncbi:MAG: YlxR family protein [Coriobacteriia bacterium]|nr:YlxR family protein [Coriobacteriia bacterium]
MAQKIPHRMCVACQHSKPRKDLVRFYKDNEGELKIDIKGTKSGRGTYLCWSLDCFDSALAKHSFSRSLKANYKVSDAQALRNEFVEALRAKDANLSAQEL